MKPDGVTMETTEPTDAAAVAEPSNPPESSSSDQASPQQPDQPAAGPSNTAVVTEARVNGARPKSATAPTKKQPVSKSESAAGSRAGATSRRPVNDVRAPNSVASRTSPLKRPTAPAAKAPGAVPKRPLGATSAVAATAKTPVKMPDKKPAGTTAAAASAMTNGTKPANGLPKKTLVAAKPKTAAPLSRPAAPAAPKPRSTSSTKPNGGVPMMSSRPATTPTSRPAAKPSTAAATNKAPSTVKTLTTRAATAPPSGRTTTAQPNKVSAPAKKDVGRPAPAATAARNTATTTAAAKKTEGSKLTANLKSSTTSAKVDAKPPPKPQQAVKPNTTRKPAAVAARLPGVSRVGQTPPASPVSKPESPGNVARSKQAHKPTQAVPRFTAGKRTDKTGTAKAAAANSNKAEASSRGAASAEEKAAAAEVQETQVESVVPLPQGLKPETTETKESVAVASILSEMVLDVSEGNTVCVPQSPVGPSVPAAEQPVITDLSAEAAPLALPSQPEDLVYETTVSQSAKPITAPENVIPQIIPLNLNEDEEEEEKEGSQQVSVSEMSGTTQPTEDSRPGSAGPVGASAWRVGGALLSELDSEEVSVSQQGASELSAPGVLEGTESMDDLGEGSLKGAMDIEGASAGSPDFEKVPEIPVNDYDDDEDDNDRVCDMDVGSERADEPQRLRHDNDVDDEEDEDVEMASEGVTESGLESYGNADEDDFAEDEKLDNLNRVAQPPPPPPLLPSAPAAQWDQPNPFFDSWAQNLPPQLPPEPDSQSGQAELVSDSPMTDPCQGDSETPTQEPAQTWLELGSVTFSNENKDVPQTSPDKKVRHASDPQMYLEQPDAGAEPSESLSPPCAPGPSPLSVVSSDSSTAEDNQGHREKGAAAAQPEAHRGDPEGAPVEGALDSAPAPDSNPSSSSVTEDEASDMEGEAQLEDSLETTKITNVTFEMEPHGPRALSTVEEGEEPEDCDGAEDATPPSATSQVSSGFDTTTSASNAQSTGESCVKSPGIFSLEELPEEAKEPPAQPSGAEQPYIVCVKEQGDSEPSSDKMATSNNLCSPSPEPQQLEHLYPIDDTQPPYYSAICEKTENSFTGFSALLHPQRRDHSSFPRTYCDIVKPVNAALASPKLSCADLPPRSPKQQPLSPQLRRLEQHQRHLLELQQRREQQSRPLEEAEQERKRREEEEERKKKDEAEEEIKRNKEEQERRLQEEEEAKRQELELQLHQQQEELKQRQQIMQWQQELQESNKGQPLLLSPSSGLCTIYEALENSEDEEGAVKCGGDSVKEQNSVTEVSSEAHPVEDSGCERVTPEPTSTHSSQDVLQRLTLPSQNGDSSSTPPESPERPSPLDLDWGKKVDIVHQLINQTLLLNGDGCSSLLLLPGGAGGTLSPLESSLWPSLLPPLTPPSATVTSVSSFSPETTGSSSQGEWTVVELETHH